MKTIINDNKKALEDAAMIQAATMRKLDEINLSLMETEQVGAETLIQLQTQREQTGRIQQDADRLKANLKKSNQLFNRLGLVSLRLRTGQKARREVKQQLTGSSTAPKYNKKHTTAITNKRNSMITRQKEGFFEQKEHLSKRGSFHQHNNNNDDDYSCVPEDCRDEFRKVVETDDQVVEAQLLHGIELQLDALLDVSRMAQQEANRNSNDLSRIGAQLEQDRYHQDVVNSRVRRFMDGRLRSKHKIRDTLLSPSRRDAAL
eukprot:CAMPEP_0118718824 /NCGR_PEP_ID=MMETSP0800-20121206/29033_1 /TAXON_ID=210618 ORGANISM="Striatella unipunctata, Strain CCMP2910" /NCGR_SAMPLE_ID=MMETSP0800 /ASSEMBLY_ACC=CAM_ASM_000638 /LENGTH=259 /DNA_ID=CAMNT_0006625923 /DNA_START=77 /DNA_END=856 /DNA_ORIENTATION=-